MKITIITASFNSADTIVDTLRSVDQQTHTNVEHLVIDGLSTDKTVQLVRANMSGLVSMSSAPDSGIYDAMNKGIISAKGDIVGILNSDDFYSTNYVLEEINSFFELDPSLDIVLGGVDFVDPSDLLRPVRKVSATGFRPWMLRFGFMPPHPAIFIRKSIYDRVGGYNLNYKIAADFEFLTRLFFIHNPNFITINKLFVRMRTGGVSTSGWRSKKVITQEMLRALRDNGVYSATPMLLMRLPIKFIMQVIL